MDLRKLVEVAEGGVRLPPLKVMAGGALYVGSLGTVDEQAEAFRRGISQHFFELQNAKKRKEAEGAFLQAYEQADALIAELPSADSRDDFGLIDCAVWFGAGGDGAEVPIARIQYSAVGAWWIGAHGRLAAQNDGGGGLGVFGGLLVPIPG